MPFPLVTTTSTDPFHRGAEVGVATSQAIRANIANYLALFQAINGIEPEAALRAGEAALAVLGEWRPALLTELEGMAAGAAVDVEMLGALNARTELVAGQECTAVGRLRGGDGPWLAQNWDWFFRQTVETVVLSSELEDGTQLTTLCEAGMLAKVGCNTNGLALALNIMKHKQDGGPMGVPIHLLLREVLASCSTVDDVASLLDGVTVSASSCFTVVCADGTGASFEICPAGVAVAPKAGADGGWVVHANHFLAPELFEGEALELKLPGTVGRVACVSSPLPETAEDAQAVLASHHAEPQPVCRHGVPYAPGLPVVGTAAGVLLRPEVGGGSLEVTDGPTCQNPWERFEVAA